MNKMSRRERVIKALEHKNTDIVPYNIELTQQAAQNLKKYTGDPAYLDDKGLHLHPYQYWGWPTENKKGSEIFLDDFGVSWNRSGADKDIGVIDHPIIFEPDIKLFKEPYLSEKRFREEIERHIATAEDKFLVAGIGFSMFERLWSYCGMENALIYMITDPDFVDELLEKICDFNIRVINILNEYPVDGIYFGDDWGQQKGLIMGPELWRRFIRPKIKSMYDAAKRKNKFVMQHSCGDISLILPDLIDVGLDCYQTFQPEIYDVDKIKAEYGSQLSFWGGISTQRLLPFASPDQVRETTRSLMERLSINGGYIAAPAHAIPSDIPAKNILAMLDVFMEQ